MRLLYSDKTWLNILIEKRQGGKRCQGTFFKPVGVRRNMNARRKPKPKAGLSDAKESNHGGKSGFMSDNYDAGTLAR
jgi:hypothetical protein